MYLTEFNFSILLYLQVSLKEVVGRNTFASNVRGIQETKYNGALQIGQKEEVSMIKKKI